MLLLRKEKGKAGRKKIDKALLPGGPFPVMQSNDYKPVTMNSDSESFVSSCL